MSLLEESLFLGDLVRQTNPSGPIIEIGTLFGWSTLVIVLNKARSQKLYTVDNYSWNPLGVSQQAHMVATTHVLREAVDLHSVHQVIMEKKDFFKLYDGGRPELVFLDANHSYEATKEDIDWSLAIGAKIICGDDYDEIYCPGVVKAVQEAGGPKLLKDGMFLL